MTDKIQTYIGFAIKKGSALLGCDSIKASKKHVYVILYTPDLSPNSFSVIKRTSEQRNCPLLKIPQYDILQKKNCKAVAICDKSLAAAICENLM